MATISSLLFLTLPGISQAFKVKDNFTIDLQVLGIYQYQDVDDADADSTGRAAIAIEPSFSYTLTENDEFHLGLGFAGGNGLNLVSPFVLSTFDANLEDDVKNLNGRHRNYLLEAWYKHTFQFEQERSLGLTGGIIDASSYIDDNEFANDEGGQFLNEVFVNSPIANLPSYDVGGAVEFDAPLFSVRGVIMNSKNDDDDFNYYALQFGYKLETGLGAGNYRVYGFTTNDRFFDPAGERRKSLRGIGVSLDQAIGENFGVFARFGWQSDDAAIDYDSLYSVGLNIKGSLWGREDDAIGLGFAHLDGGNGGIDATNALEAYIKFKLFENSALTLDFQYLKDEYKDAEDVKGFVYGARINAEF